MKKSTIIKIVSGVAIGAITTAAFVKYFPTIRKKIDDFLDEDDMEDFDYEEEEEYYDEDLAKELEEEAKMTSIQSEKSDKDTEVKIDVK